jgi:hypothetical protein
MKCSRLTQAGVSSLTSLQTQLIPGTLRGDACLTPIWDLCYSTGKKTVTAEWLAQMDLPALTYWWMDDGSLCNSRSARFNAQAFSRKENALLANWLTKQGFDASASFDKGKYWRVDLCVAPARKMIAAILPFMHA